jgi:Arc/MetJ-type ribon-helix-helix transcriptional regulator
VTGQQEACKVRSVEEAERVTIQITRPELEALIKRRLETGGFKDAEDVILQALKLSEQVQTSHSDKPPEGPESVRPGSVVAEMRAVRARIQADPGGWTTRDYVGYGRH